MRTTLDIDTELLAEVMRLGSARTKKEAVAMSLAEFVRRRKIEELIAMAGTMDLDMDLEELERLRGDD